MIEGLIVRSLSGFYTVKTHDGKEYICRAKGVFRHKDIKPFVGDRVKIELDDKEDNKGIVAQIDARKNQLVRPPVANIDQAFVITSLKEPEFAPNLIDKFLLILGMNDIEPIICINKCDLGNIEDIMTYIKDYQMAGYTVLTLSALNPQNGLMDVELFKDKISIFTGQSGVGKSSILNILNPNLKLATNEISKALNRGKHTTRHTELFMYGGGYIADTPGFSSLEIPNDPQALSIAFKDFNEYAKSCKFRGCLHESEPNCGVKQALKENKILLERYNRYLSFLNEMKERKMMY